MSRIFFLLPLLFTLAQAQSLTLRTVGSVPASIPETSGLVCTGPNYLWSHNDGGSPAEIQAFDTNGTVVRTLDLLGVSNVDWEDLTRDDAGNFYVGDFGNNLNDRTNLVIYKIPPPDSITGDSVVPGRIEFTYPDQFAFPPPDSLKNFDMEAFVAYGDSLYLFSKNRTNPFDGYTKMYRLPQDTGTYVAELIDSFYAGPGPSTSYWVSGAALSPGKDHLILLSYPRCWLFSCYQGADFFGGASVMRTYPLSQMEAAAWKDSTHLYLTDELINGAFGGKLYEADMTLLVTEPTADLGPDTTFIGDTLFLHAPQVSGASYLWSTGATTNPVALTQSGQYWVQVMASNGCTVSDTINVTILVSNETELAEGLTVSVRPNPFTHSTLLEMEFPGAGTCQWRIRDLQGKELVQIEPFQVQAGTWKLEMRTQFPAGIYFLEVEYGGQWFARKLIRL